MPASRKISRVCCPSFGGARRTRRRARGQVPRGAHALERAAVAGVDVAQGADRADLRVRRDLGVVRIRDRVAAHRVEELEQLFGLALLEGALPDRLRLDAGPLADRRLRRR